jgi:acetyl-CoA carboxylase carboxyl transferase subunit alpha
MQQLEEVIIELTPWQRVLICRHKYRPKTLDYIRGMCDSFQELHGDRTFADDQAIVGGIGFIGGRKFVIIGQEKGSDTETRIKHNFGAPHPEGYRKALRLMELAEKFKLPVVTLIDTSGAYCGLTAEERGQGWAIAKNLLKMARLRTPITCVLIGEGCSGGALGIGIGDVVGMLEHSYYSVISPEGCASILWKDAKNNEEASKVLKMHGEDLLKIEVIDEIIPEPIGGAHNDPDSMFSKVKEFILRMQERFADYSLDDLVEARYERFRKLGAHLVLEQI